MEIKCIHTGDLHLGMEFKNASFDIKQAQKRRIELWETFNRIVDRAIENKCDFLFIAGDLFEDDYCSIGDIKRIASKFKEASDVNIVIAAGNHDTFCSKSLYKLIKWPENVYIFQGGEINSIEFENLNTIVWGFSWDKKEERRRLIDNIQINDRNKINILLLHGDIFNSYSQYLPIDKESLTKIGFDYVALGHIHKPQFINDRIGYCGSPEPLDFGETGAHGIIEGIISKKSINMEFTQFCKRMFLIKGISIDSSLGYQDIIKKIIDCDEEKNRRCNMYRIILKGLKDSDIKINTDEIKEIIKDKFYYVELIDNTAPDYDLERMKKENSDNIIGYYIKAMEEKGLDNSVVRDALYFGLEALLKEKVKK